MQNLRRRRLIVRASMIMFSMAIVFSLRVHALEQKPEATPARWSGAPWGIVRVLPGIVKYGDQIHIHGIVVGGPAGEPGWMCTQWGWAANGTSSISIAVPADWDMPSTSADEYVKKNTWTKDGGEPPPLGWDNRISDTCYCDIKDFGAEGGCATAEVKPDLFKFMDEFNPRSGNVQFATVMSGSGWTGIRVMFTGRAGVSWVDWATDYVYVVSDESMLEEDSDSDGLSDAWEYANSPNQSLNDFSGGTITQSSRIRALSEEEWVNPYAPKEPGWVSAGPDDWDGDGFSNKDEYVKWKNNKRDNDDWPFDPAFINSSKAGTCPAKAALGESSREGDIIRLRKFRDQVLSKTTTGQEIIRLYYAWGPAIVQAMDEDAAFKQRVKELIEEALDFIGKIE